MVRARKIHLVTYGTPEFRAAQECLARSALEFGHIDDVHSFGPEDIKPTSFYARNREILESSRGAGYWLWKPYVILEQLRRIRRGDFVFYYDCGRQGGYRIRRPIDPIVAWAIDAGTGVMPGISIPHYGRNARWTKRDCFVYMDCDAARFWDHAQIQATLSIWENNSFACDFISTWLDCCGDPRVITDEPNTCGKDNLPDFVAHRHDQSVLTNLVLRHEVPYIHTESRLTDWLVRLTKRRRGAFGRAIDFTKDVNNVVALARGIPSSVIYGRELVRCIRRLDGPS